MITSLLLFLFIFLSFLYSSKSLGVSLLIASYFLSLTPLGETNIHIPVILISILFCLYNKLFILNTRRLYFLLALLLINAAPIFLSFNFDLYKTIGKSLKIFVLLFPLCFIYTGRNFINFSKLKNSLAITSLVFSFLWLTVRIYDGGFLYDIRISGIVLDPNYSVIVLCSIFMLTFVYKPAVKFNISTLILITIVILTQSISSLLIFLLLFFILKIYKKPLKNNFLFYLLLLLVIFDITIVLYISNNTHLTMLPDWNTSYISLKINSLLVRLYSQIEGMKMMLADPIHFLYGFGSHTSVEMFGKVMHNAYLQTFFDHGIILLISMFLYINIICKKYNFYIIILYLQIMNFLFDNYFMGIISLFFILGLILDKKILKENTIENEKNIRPNVIV